MRYLFLFGGLPFLSWMMPGTLGVGLFVRTKPVANWLIFYFIFFRVESLEAELAAKMQEIKRCVFVCVCACVHAHACASVSERKGARMQTYRERVRERGERKIGSAPADTQSQLCIERYVRFKSSQFRNNPKVVNSETIQTLRSADTKAQLWIERNVDYAKCSIQKQSK